MFVRRSRKGRIHVVRERVADGYARLSKGLARANKGVIDGVWSVHKGLQLGLAKGHQGVQSGLKTVQDFTGDFSMYYRRNSYYQYEEPVAMFSMAEVEKFNKYNSGEAIAQFGVRSDLKAGWGAVKKAPGAAYRAVKSGLSGGYGLARSGVVGGYGLAKGGLGLAGRGVVGGSRLLGGLAAAGTGLAGAGLAHLGGGSFKDALASDRGLVGIAKKMGANSGKTGAAIAALTAAGVGGTMFMRRRRTKKGKIVVEQVRR